MEVQSALVCFKGKISCPLTTTLGHNALPHNGIGFGFDARRGARSTKIINKRGGVASWKCD